MLHSINQSLANIREFLDIETDEMRKAELLESFEKLKTNRDEVLSITTGRRMDALRPPEVKKRLWIQDMMEKARKRLNQIIRGEHETQKSETPNK